MVDPNIFFRNATLQICSSIDIQKALWKCLMYIHENIPVEQMSLHLYNRSTGMADTIAHATLAGYKSVSIKTRLGEKGRQQILNQKSIRIRLVENTSDDHVAGPFCRKLDCLDRSAIIMILVLEGKFLGVATFQSLRGEKFKEIHKQIVAPLNEPFAIAMTNSIHYRKLQEFRDLLVDDNKYFQLELRKKSGEHVIGADSGLKEVMELVRLVSVTDSPVLLLGETGVGKELIANTIHNLSRRRDGPFIDVNCGAIPESLMDSELFGHEKGAFTGAISQKRGRFERAQGGTIFLDEIGEIIPEAQIRMLRVLQEKKIERIGSSNSRKTDIRVIAATHRKLDKMVERGDFRKDLFFRLNVFPIFIPPLKNRKADIPPLVHHFLRKKSVEMKLGFQPDLAPGAIDSLMKYEWPGNVRELENTIERAIILSRGQQITFGEFALSKGSDSVQDNRGGAAVPEFPGEILSLDKISAQHIRNVLKLTKGKIDGENGAAKLLEINSRTLRHRMKKLGVPFGAKAKKYYE